MISGVCDLTFMGEETGGGERAEEGDFSRGGRAADELEAEGDESLRFRELIGDVD